MTEFKCKMCEQSNKKIHGEERGGGQCPLIKILEKGIIVPEKESLINYGILICEKIVNRILTISWIDIVIQ